MYATFPIKWSSGDKPSDGRKGPPVEDAGTIYVLCDFDDEVNGIDVFEGAQVLRTNLMEIVDDCLSGWATADGFTHEEDVPSSRALSAALRAAADRLDAGINPASVTS